MAELEGIMEIVNQVAIQAAMAVTLALRNRCGIPTNHHRKPQINRHDVPILVTPAFNWDIQDRYAELVNFELEVTFWKLRAYKLRKKRSQ